MLSNNILNVVFSSDDNYVQHMGASIYSLLIHNKNFSQINVFIINNEISERNIIKINQMVGCFENAKVQWILFDKWKEKLRLNMEWNISLSSYARLFIGSMLTEEIEKVLYLDCDTIIKESLDELWGTDINGYLIGAVQDTVSTRVKSAVGLQPNQPYFNAGMLLINLKEWRTENMEKKCIQFIDDHKGNVRHHDQGVINGLVVSKAKILPLKYNVMTIHYIFSRKKTLKYFQESATFYDFQEIEMAKRSPVIIHFTPSFTSHPWVRGCCHPMRDIYWQIIRYTPWKDEEIKKNNKKWYIRFIEWIYKHLPF